MNRTSCLARHVLVRGILVETLVRRSHVCSGICPNSELFRRQKTLAAIAANILLRQPFSLHQSCRVWILHVVLDSYVAFFYQLNSQQLAELKVVNLVYEHVFMKP